MSAATGRLNANKGTYRGEIVEVMKCREEAMKNVMITSMLLLSALVSTEAGRTAKPVSGLKNFNTKIYGAIDEGVAMEINSPSTLSGVTRKDSLPNIIFILSDDIGIGDVKCYYEPSKVKTPNIDKLAAEGMRFTQAYAPGAVCGPSRYALMSGSYPCRNPISRTQMVTSSPLSCKGMVTLSSVMKGMGYRTAHVGKWHLGYGPEGGIKNWAGEISPGANDIGFDYHLGIPTNHSDGFKTYVENDRLLWLKPEVTELRGKPTKEQLTQIRLDDEVDSTLTAKAIEFIKQDPEEPFFIYLALVATHTHITPHETFRGTSELGLYGDYLHELDYHVGEIMETLDELNLADNTIIFFSSDNGGQENDPRGAGIDLNLRSTSHDILERSKTAKADARVKYGHRTNGDLRGYKGQIYEGGIRVPFIVRWPEKIKPGTESDHFITLADTLATTVGILGEKLPASAGVDSFDFSPVFFGEDVKPPVRTTGIFQTGRGKFAIRQDNWKLCMTTRPTWNNNELVLPESGYELYNLGDDPGESRDIYQQQPERAKQLRELLLDLVTKGRSR